MRSISAGPDGALYANVHVGGIARSADGGSTWTSTIDIDTDVHQVLAHPSRAGVVLAALGEAGLGLSLDSGETWEQQTDGLHAGYCRAVAVAGETVLLSASESHVGRRSALYRRALDGRTFERCAGGLPEWFGENLDTRWLAADGSFAALGTPDGEVYLSEDAGSSWRRVATGLPEIRCVLLAP